MNVKATPLGFSTVGMKLSDVPTMIWDGGEPLIVIVGESSEAIGAEPSDVPPHPTPDDASTADAIKAIVDLLPREDLRPLTG